jgi:hypothetical protein
MTVKEAIEILEDYNRWRRGANIDQPNSKIIVTAINKAVKELKKVKNENKTRS